MTAKYYAPATEPVPPRRRPFAAKRRHRGWGIGLGVFGAFGLYGFLRDMLGGTTGETDPVVGVLISLGCIALTVYLLRGPDPSSETRRLHQVGPRPEVAVASAEVADAAAALQAAMGGAALVAYRNLEATVRQRHPRDAEKQLSAALSSIEFDLRAIDSPVIGYVATVDGGYVEVFRDWVVLGQTAHDVEPSTRGDVYMDGSVQVTSTAVTDAKGRERVLKEEHDLRTAHLQFTSASWRMGAAIPPDTVNQARMLVAQVGAHATSLVPSSATSEDISAIVRAIINSTDQPPAEKLRQLGNLRFERLLTDEEFARAKSVILGI